MRIICRKGFYKFYPQEVGEIRRFQTKYGVVLVESEDYFTFPVLAGLPNYSFVSHPYSGLFLGLVNYAGKKEDVLAQNGYTYYQPTQSLVLKGSFVKKMDYSFSNFIFMSTLPQAYCYDENGVISGFNGFCDVDFMRFKIERFFYESI
tara:strand:- start:891 stop:1334 length:444 start_codon:yes stop_codon:yes gene_type:complete